MENGALPSPTLFGFFGSVWRVAEGRECCERSEQKSAKDFKTRGEIEIVVEGMGGEAI